MFGKKQATQTLTPEEVNRRNVRDHRLLWALIILDVLTFAYLAFEMFKAFSK